MTDAELNAAFDRIAASLAETAARQAETAARQAKTDALLDELAARQAKSDARLDRVSDKLDRVSDKLDRVSDKLDRVSDKLDRASDKIDRLAVMYGGVGNSQGEVAEEFYYNSLKAAPSLGGVRFDVVLKNVTSSHAGVEEEYDLLLVNGRLVYVVEVKYKAHENDLQRLLDRKVANFPLLFPLYADRERRGALATFHIRDDLKDAALAEGVTILQRKGDVIETLAA